MVLPLLISHKFKYRSRNLLLDVTKIRSVQGENVKLMQFRHDFLDSLPFTDIKLFNSTYKRCLYHYLKVVGNNTHTYHKQSHYSISGGHFRALACGVLAKKGWIISNELMLVIIIDLKYLPEFLRIETTGPGEH